MKNLKIVKPYFHGDHFGAVFGFTDRSKVIMDEIIPDGIKGKGNKFGNIEAYNKKYDNIKILSISIYKKRFLFKIKKEYLVSFPYFETDTFYDVNITELLEWNIFGGSIESQLRGKINNLMGINLYLTDYYKNKNIYLENTKLKLGIGGFAYTLSKTSNEGRNKSFTGYLPLKDMEHDEFQFVGKILDKTPSNCKTKKGYFFIIKIADGQGEQDFNIKIFCLEENMETEINKSDFVSGVMWMFGYIGNK